MIHDENTDSSPGKEVLLGNHWEILISQDLCTCFPPGTFITSHVINYLHTLIPLICAPFIFVQRICAKIKRCAKSLFSRT